MHRRTDSDVSVQGLATMFEGLEVKDPREAAQRYKQMLDREKIRWMDKFNRHEKDHSAILERKALRIEELESELAQARSSLQVGVSREQYEKEWKANQANVKKWEQVFKEREERWTSDSIKVVSSILQRVRHDAANDWCRKPSKNRTGSSSPSTANTRSTPDRCRPRTSG